MLALPSPDYARCPDPAPSNFVRRSPCVLAEFFGACISSTHPSSFAGSVFLGPTGKKHLPSPASDPSLSMRIAIISDLHCHIPGGRRHGDSGDSGEHISWIYAGAPRDVAENHPIEALRRLFPQGQRPVDLLVCPGDMTDRGCRAGLDLAWHAVHEIKHIVGATRVLAAVGNHDVDSRRISSSDPFALARQCRPRFPHRDDTTSRYWSDGFFLTSTSADSFSLGVAVLNTVLGHTDSASAERGVFSERSLAALDEALHSEWATSHDTRLALMHHHPVLHSQPGADSSDVLATGDALIKTLQRHSFGLVIHGHRHHPRVTRISSSLHIVAAGSFSAFFKENGSNTRNVFHVIDLSTTSTRLTTWEFQLGAGWVPATVASSGILHEMSLGSTPPPTNILASRVAHQVPTGSAVFQPWTDALRSVPELSSLLTNELRELAEVLKTMGIGIAYSNTGMPVGLGRMVL